MAKPTEYNCPVCSKLYKTKEGLMRHASSKCITTKNIVIPLNTAANTRISISIMPTNIKRQTTKQTTK